MQFFIKSVHAHQVQGEITIQGVLAFCPYEGQGKLFPYAIFMCRAYW